MKIQTLTKIKNLIAAQAAIVLSHNHYAVSDREAGRLARVSPGNGGKLPRIGYERDVILSDGRNAVLKRTRLTLLDPMRNKRGWVWTVMPADEVYVD